jgi:hypothetical protein
MFQPDKQILSVIVWGLLQLSILGIGASGFPLWAHHPFPRQSLALQEMLVSQTLLIALLFPGLISKPWHLGIALVLMLPMDELAGSMSSSSQACIWMGFVCVGVWMAGVGGWALLLKDSASQIAIAGLATIVTAGGAILDYLRWEAAASNGQSSAFSPISMLPKLCQSIETHTAVPCIQASFPAIALVVVRVIQHVIKPPKPSSTSLHSSR